MIRAASKKQFLIRTFIFQLLIALITSSLPCSGDSREQAREPKLGLHSTTDWRVNPSFMLDTLCFINVLTGDPFYLRYYKDEYARFEPQLTPAARIALSNLKRKIKDDNKNHPR
jgi:hypothetical protein